MSDPEVTREIGPVDIRPEPVGVKYCLAHHGLREEDESGGCAWQDDERETPCQLVELYPGTQVVETYVDPFYEEDEGDE